MTDIPILVAGDPHGRWSPIHAACRREAVPGVVLLLGDCDLERPLADVMATEIAAGWRVRYIIGNHDSDTPEVYDNLVGSLPDGNLGNRWAHVNGLIVAGLSGTYRGKVWYPNVKGAEPPRFRTRADYLRQVRRHERWRNGVPLPMRSAVFPEDHDAVARFRLDVLVSHEAPRTAAMGEKGFQGLSDLLTAAGARLAIHGHHHRSYSEDLVLSSGRVCRVRGLAIGEVGDLRCRNGKNRIFRHQCLIAVSV